MPWVGHNYIRNEKGVRRAFSLNFITIHQNNIRQVWRYGKPKRLFRALNLETWKLFPQGSIAVVAEIHKGLR